MTIKVTLRIGEKSTRREYRTYERAISALKKWFSNNDGIALLYQPGEQPVVYKTKHELPLLKAKTQKNFYSTKAWRELRFAVLMSSNGKCRVCGANSETGVKTATWVKRQMNFHLSTESHTKAFNLSYGFTRISVSNENES